MSSGVAIDEDAVLRRARSYVADHNHQEGVYHLIQHVRVPTGDLAGFSPPKNWSIDSIGPWHGEAAEKSVCVVLRRQMPLKPGPRTILKLAAEIMGCGASQITLTWLARELCVSARQIRVWLIDAGLCKEGRHGLEPVKPKAANGLLFWMQRFDMNVLHAKPQPSRKRGEEDYFA